MRGSFCRLAWLRVFRPRRLRQDYVLGFLGFPFLFLLGLFVTLLLPHLRIPDETETDDEDGSEGEHVDQFN